MRIIKVFNDFINEELSPLTIYNTAQKFKEKGHKNRYFNLKNTSSIFITSKKYDTYNVSTRYDIKKVIGEVTNNEYDNFVQDFLLSSPEDDILRYYSLTFDIIYLSTGEDLMEDNVGEREYLSLGVQFNINGGEYKDILDPFTIFMIDIPIIWNNESFKIDIDKKCLVTGEWIYDTTNYFYDRKSAVKFRREVLLKLKDIIKSYKKDERLKYSYQEFLNVFGDFSTMKEMDIMFSHIVNSISVNDLYRD